MSTLEPTKNADRASLGSTPVPGIDARQLALLAEWADGLRDRKLMLVRDANAEFKLKEPDRVDREDTVILQVYTGDAVPDRLEPVSIKCTLPGGGSAIELADSFDAMFWTESAMEKFFFPYYYAQRILTEKQMQAIKDLFANRNVCAFLHMPPSRPGALQGRHPTRVTDTVAVLEKVSTQGPVTDGGGALVAYPLSRVVGP